MKLRTKIIIPVALMFILWAIFQLYMGLKELKIREAVFITSVKESVKNNVSELSSIAKMNLQTALMISRLPNVVVALELKNRRALFDMAKDLAKTLNEVSAYPVYIHFHVPPGISFLRVWDPDSYGDNISSFRKTVVDVLQSKKPVAGIEAGIVGLAVRGVAPIMSEDGKVVGSVEVFNKLDDIMSYFSLSKGEINTLFILKEVLPAKLVSSYERKDFVSYRMLHNELSKLIDDKFLEKAIIAPFYEEKDGFLIVGYPIKDYNGENIAVYIRIEDLAPFLTAFKNYAKRNFFFVAVALLLCLLATFWIIKIAVLNPLELLSDQLKRLSKFVGRRHADPISDIKIPVEIKQKDEIGEVARIVSKIVRDFDDLTLFRQAIEADQTTKEVYWRLGEVFEKDIGFDGFVIYDVDAKRRLVRTVMKCKKSCPECSSLVSDVSSCYVVRSGDIASSIHPASGCSRFDMVKPDAEGFACVPLISGSGVLGVVQLLWKGELGMEKLDKAIAYIQEAVPVVESKRAFEALKDQSLRDPLTGLYNRRVLEEFVPAIVANIKRRDSVLGVVMIDVDRFKRINDTYGHAFGDEVLKTIASIIKGRLRKSDLAIRYGGEEFLLLLVDVDETQTINVAEYIRLQVQQQEFTFFGETAKVTISCGVAEYPVDADRFETVVGYADRALYMAKEQGRNCVVRFRKPSL